MAPKPIMFPVVNVGEAPRTEQVGTAPPSPQRENRLSCLNVASAPLATKPHGGGRENPDGFHGLRGEDVERKAK